MMRVMRWRGRYLQWTKDSKRFQSVCRRRWWDCWLIHRDSTLYVWSNAHKKRHFLFYFIALCLCCQFVMVCFRWLSDGDYCRYQFLPVKLGRLRCGSLHRHERLLKDLWYPWIGLVWKGLTRIRIWICVEMEVNWLVLELLVGRARFKLHHLYHIAMIW